MPVLLKVFLLTIVAVAGPASARHLTQESKYMRNWDRPGGDYRRVHLNGGSYSQCANLCSADSRCWAWSLVRRTRMCYLKNRIPPRVRNNCCTSGINNYVVYFHRPGGPGLRQVCNNYARSAVNQNNQNLRRRCGYRGGRWSANYQGHFNWCMGVNERRRKSESRVRNTLLARCRAGSSRPPAGQRTQRFNYPRINNEIVDNCAPWGRNCGWGAANYFCRRKGFARSLNWNTVKNGRTWVMITNRKCVAPYCTGFSQVTCTSAAGGTRPPVGGGDRFAFLGSRWYVQGVAGWRGVWTRRPNTNQFSGRWWHSNGARVTANLTVNVRGRTVSVFRRDTSGADVGGSCNYTGTANFNGTAITGHSSCTWSRGPHPWRAQIVGGRIGR